MLRTTIVKNELAWALAFISTCCFSIPTFGQEDSLQDPVSKNQPSVFEKLFGKSNVKSSETNKPKPKVPAIPTTGKPARSGFLLPLKSFSRPFRVSTESEDGSEVQEAAPPSSIQSRASREPFRNPVRAQERRDRDTIDLHVQQLTQDTPPTANRIYSSKPAPIVTPESMRSTNAAPSNSKTTGTKSHSKPVVAGTKSLTPEIIIESNSTSRKTTSDKTASDLEKHQKTVSNTVAQDSRDDPRTQKSSDSKVDAPLKIASVSRSATAPKGLIDLGFESEHSNNHLAASATRDLDTKASGENRTQPQSSDIPRTLPPASSSKRDARDSAIEARDKGKVAKEEVVATPAALRREMSLPGVRVTVNGQNSILVNDASRFEVIAKNEGAETLNGLIVRIAVPPHVSISDIAVTEGVALPENDNEGNTIIWELGQIAAGSYKTAVVSIKTLKAEHFALGVEWTVLPQNAEMQIEVQQPQLAIALEGPSEVTFGKPQLYRIRVRNTGNAEVKSVSVAMSAEPYGSNQSDIGDISAGSERIVEVELTFQQSGALPIVASASSEVSKVNARSAIDVQVRQSDLVATWFGPAEFYQGSLIDYELELTNVGSISALGTTCVVKLPPGTDTIAMPAGATRNGDNIKWDILKIDSHEKISIPFRLSMSKHGINQLYFAGTCSSSSEVKAEFKTNIDAIADLHLTVVDPVAPAPVGQPVVYEVVIANRGKKSANDVEVIAQFSDGIEPTRVDGHTGRIVPGQAIFNSIPSIAANDKLVLRIHAEASKPGVHRFRVEVKSKGSETDLLEEESTRYLATSIKGDRR